MASVLLCSSAVRVHDSQAYRKTDVTRERISRILELSEILLSSQTGFNLVIAAVVCVIVITLSVCRYYVTNGKSACFFFLLTLYFIVAIKEKLYRFYCCNITIMNRTVCLNFIGTAPLRNDLDIFKHVNGSGVNSRLFLLSPFSNSWSIVLTCIEIRHTVRFIRYWNSSPQHIM